MLAPRRVNHHSRSFLRSDPSDKALSTEDSYLFWLRRYIGALRATPASLPSEKKVEAFLTDLARRHDVSASTQNQAFNALLFFYRDVLHQPLANVDALRNHSKPPWAICTPRP